MARPAGAVHGTAAKLASDPNNLKRYGVLDNSARGVWALTSKGQKCETLEEAEVKRAVQSLDQVSKDRESTDSIRQTSLELEEMEWEDHLLKVIKKMRPDSFERLCQRLLRESGFIQVEKSQAKRTTVALTERASYRLAAFYLSMSFFNAKDIKGVFIPQPSATFAAQ